LHVLPRHRLPLEAEVGERTVAVPVVDVSGHLPVADMEYGGSLRPHLLELQSACLAAPTHAGEHKHALIVNLAVLMRLDAIVLPGVEDAAGALCHPGEPRPATGSRPVHPHILDLGVSPLHRAEVAALPARVDP